MDHNKDNIYEVEVVTSTPTMENLHNPSRWFKRTLLYLKMTLQRYSSKQFQLTQPMILTATEL